MNLKILSIQQRIDVLESKARTSPANLDSELQAQLARFLCVLTSGLIEQALIIILEDYAKIKSEKRVAQFASQQLSRIHNAKFNDILVTLGRFDPAWRDYFELNTEDEVKAAIDSVVNNRNQVAHGQQAGVSLAAFGAYYRLTKKFITDLEAFIGTQ